MRLSSRRSILAPALALVAAGATSQRPLLPRTPQGIIRAAEQAVATRRAAAVRQDWLGRLRRDPTNRLARLGVAAFARFAYDYAAADSFASRLFARPGTRPDSIAAWARIEIALAFAQRWRLVESDSTLAVAAADAAIARDGSAEGAALSLLGLLRGRTQGVDAGLALLDRAARVIPPNDSTGRALAVGLSSATRARPRCARRRPARGLRPAAGAEFWGGPGRGSGVQHPGTRAASR